MRTFLASVFGVVAFLVVMAVALTVLGGGAGGPEVMIVAVLAAAAGILVARGHLRRAVDRPEHLDQ